MKKLLLFLSMLAWTGLLGAYELESRLSRALLEEIRTDINSTLSRIMVLEEPGWTVHISRNNDKLIRVGLVIEPTSNTVLSVTADGIGNQVGLRAGDVIKSFRVNGTTIEHDFSNVQLTHGDKLRVFILRDREEMVLESYVNSSYVPIWELYSSSNTQNIPKSYSVTANELQSPAAIKLLNELQGRINLRLSEIYRFESKLNDSDFKLDIEQGPQTYVSLGMAIDQDSKKIIRVEKGGQADQAGLTSGDIISRVVVNGNTLTDLSDLDISHGDILKFFIVRSGSKSSVELEVNSRSTPSWYFSVNSAEEYDENTCGIITVFFDPPYTRDIYKALITEVDGDLQVQRDDSVTLSAGKHRILIHERIPSKFRTRISRGKLVEFMIKPNKRYFLGVKFDRNKRFSKQGKYWEPYVWKVEDYECSLD